MAYEDSEESDPKPDASMAFFHVIMSSANRYGQVIVESSVCPKCSVQNTHVHPWVECLTCMNPGCGTRYESKVPRRPALGEPSADDYRNAIEALHDAQVLQIREGKPKPVQAELDALPAGTRLLIERARLASVREFAIKVLAVAEQLASLGIRLPD